MIISISELTRPEIHRAAKWSFIAKSQLKSLVSVRPSVDGAERADPAAERAVLDQDLMGTKRRDKRDGTRGKDALEVLDDRPLEGEPDAWDALGLSHRSTKGTTF
ncbi:hypothetical protein EVAR_65901_1 [Eumeta japonica]|uniref:Uncharacterized protein n=1 Tax=Eumeta variegata TaxID=151549 RepID=A0A4C1ZYT6_EUMVA|nr:hypothetical protein EVAR_65901_1 [Eumeta japonica]